MLRLSIALCLLILVCGQIVLWRRRDNVLGYVQGATFLTSFLLPLVGTRWLDDFDDVARLYATILLVGAAGYSFGLVAGARLGNRPAGTSNLTFAEPLDSGTPLARIGTRITLVSLAGILGLGAAYALLGYAPLFAEDRIAAKYGVGAYTEAFARARIPYNFALAVASTVLPAALALLLRKRSLVQFALAAGLLFGLALSLSRTLAFWGVVIFAIAVALERKIRPVLIFTAVTAVFLGAAIANEILLPVADGAGRSLSARVAESAPDVRDHLFFLRGFEANPRFRRWSIFGGLGAGRGGDDPTIYALQVVTGAEDVSQLASGGIRMPAPMWGYASFGLAGAAAWSLLSGFFVGWGTTRIRNVLTRVAEEPRAGLNVVLAVVFYTGTYEVAATFYFATTAMLVHLAVAVYLGHRLPRLQRLLPFERPKTDRPAEEPAEAGAENGEPAPAT